MLASGYFYKINNTVVMRSKLNTALIKGEKLYDITLERQGAVLKILVSDLEKIKNLCKSYKREMPTEIKIIFDVEKNKLQAKYRYDLVYSNDPEKLPDDIEDEWFKEIKKENNQ